MQEWLPVNLVTRAESGDLDAMFELGEFGSAFQVNNTVHWLVRAASGGHARAMVSLAFLSAAPVDASSAIDWLRSAIKQLGVNAVNDDGVSLCHRAVAHSRADLLECLIAAGADVNVVDKLGRTPCHAAALSGNDPFVRRLIAAGANVAAQDTSGRTPLHAAVWSGHDTIVDMLIVARSPLDALDNDGRSPCHDAVANSCESALRRLVAAGANVKTVDKHGRTPFHAAAINGCERMAEMLVAAGADVTTADHLGRTPLHDAVRFSRAAIVEALIATGVRVMATDNEGRTPCHDAVANFNEPVVHMLLGAGANVDAADNLGRKPLDTAPNSRARDAFNRMLFRCIGAGVVTRSFDAARAALGAARAVRGQLASLDSIAPLITESARADGLFGAVGVICARAAEYAEAESTLAAQQSVLRAAEQLDPLVVAARDAARAQLAAVAASILASNQAPLGALTTLGNRVAAAKAALSGFQCSDGKGDEIEFDAWLAGAHGLTAFKSALTEAGAEALATTVQSLCVCSSDVNGQSVEAALARARVAAEREKRALDGLRVPRAIHAELVRQLGDLRDRVVQAHNLVDRARHVRAVAAPSCERLQAAQSSAVKIEKQIKLALVELEHPEDAESEAAAKANVRELKAALFAAQRESTAAVVELAAHVFDFPELRLRFPKARLDDLIAADGDATVFRTLGVYDNRQVIAVTRHKVERASFGGVECALKLFHLLPANQRAFVKEARRLRQLAHPNVVEVRAVFVDGATGVIEMPLYAHGDLWQWLAAAAPVRTVHDKVRVLRATLCGLEHVHRMGVVHADVKPENVFVDADGVAKLGDFDVSKDDATRITMAATVVGFSLAYAAPEIKNGGAASKPGDMYAFGLTLFDVVLGEQPIKERPVDFKLLARYEPIEGGTSLRDVTHVLLEPVAADRIDASGALEWPLFAPPPPGRDPERDRRECSVCFNSHWHDEGIGCDAEHFVCNGDLEAFAQMFCAAPLAEAAKRGALRCLTRGCTAAAWSNASLAQSLRAEQFTAYVDKLREVSENRALVEQRQRHEAELAELERRLRGEMARDEEVATHRRVVRDDLLCLRCPRCKAAFVVDDFNRCLAMTCANCNAAFCAWCLRDCGRDAHAHVNSCERNPMRPRTVFSNAAQFEKAHRERYAEVVSEYLRTLRNEEIRAAVREAIQRDLADLGVAV